MESKMHAREVLKVNTTVSFGNLLALSSICAREALHMLTGCEDHSLDQALASSVDSLAEVEAWEEVMKGMVATMKTRCLKLLVRLWLCTFLGIRKIESYFHKHTPQRFEVAVIGCPEPASELRKTGLVEYPQWLWSWCQRRLREVGESLGLKMTEGRKIDS
ncbi:unnamed protein product [Symbiodinium sp. CCMP2592]|nr:unnamed protein product [Symbiodinium sp. CCMP2592]